LMGKTTTEEGGTCAGEAGTEEEGNISIKTATRISNGSMGIMEMRALAEEGASEDSQDLMVGEAKENTTMMTCTP